LYKDAAGGGPGDEARSIGPCGAIDSAPVIKPLRMSIEKCIANKNCISNKKYKATTDGGAVQVTQCHIIRRIKM